MAVRTPAQPRSHSVAAFRVADTQVTADLGGHEGRVCVAVAAHNSQSGACHRGWPEGSAADVQHGKPVGLVPCELSIRHQIRSTRGLTQAESED